MNRTKRSIAGAGLVLCAALAVTLSGCVAQVAPPPRRVVYVPPPPVAPPPVVYVPPPPVEPPPPPVVYVPPPPVEPVVVIQTESDFYEPLSPYGSWVVIGTYGRCWRPARVETEWRPYANGYWQRTDAGWYWSSEEPWGWATYHYGRWDWTVEFGWVWIPHTQWAPAWVSWRQGSGYVGWAPLPPAARFAGSGIVEVREPTFAPRAFVFVEERRLLEPVRRTTVIINNTTVINKTVNITKIQVVNKTVVNEGPHPEAIERVSGRRVEAVPVHELRRKEETAVATRQPKIRSVMEGKAQPARRVESGSRTSVPSGRSLKIESPPEVTRAPSPPPVTEGPRPAQPAPVAKPLSAGADNVVRGPRHSDTESEKARVQGRQVEEPAKASLPPDAGQVRRPAEAIKAPPPAPSVEVRRPAQRAPGARPVLPDSDKIVTSPKFHEIESNKATSQARRQAQPDDARLPRDIGPVEKGPEAIKPPPSRPSNNPLRDSETNKPARSLKPAQIQSPPPTRETSPKPGAKNKKKTDDKKGEEPRTPPAASSRSSTFKAA